MKALKYLSFILTCSLFVAGCDSMDSVYLEFIGEKPNTYTAIPEGITAFAGVNKVKFVVPKQTDPRIKGLQFYWDNKTGSQDVVINPLVDNEIIIENITDGSHIFEIFSHDDKGNHSVPLSMSVNAYGDIFLSSTPMSSVLSVCRNSSGLCMVKMHHSSSIYYQYMEIEYVDKTGKDKIMKVERGTNILYLDDIGGNKLSYKSYYLPEETAFEPVVTESVVIPEISNPSINVNENVSLAFPSGSEVFLDCVCTWEASAKAESDCSSWLEVTLTDNFLKLKAKSRNGNESARVGTVTIKSDEIAKTIIVSQQALSSKIGTAYGSEGIVFWQNPEKPQEYKIISAAGTVMPWSTRNSITGAISYSGITNINGEDYNNDDLIRNMPDYNNGNTYALSWIEDLGEGWYMPSINELKDELWPVYNGATFETSTKSGYSSATADEKLCRDKFEAAMASIGGQKLNMATSTSADGTCIMSNAEANASSQFGFRMSNSAIISTAKTSASHYVRGIKIVTITD